MAERGYFDSLGPSGRVDKAIDNILKQRFLEPFEVEYDEGNGLRYENKLFPEEMLTKILTFVSPDCILATTLVCKQWNNIIKSTHFWVQIYERKHHKIPKQLPWYVFYCYFGQNLLNCNLLKNGNGQEGLNYWDLVNEEYGTFGVEWDPLLATDSLPPNVPDFNGYGMCFVVNGESCAKKQAADLFESKLLFYIVNKFGPDIYLSDWVAVRNDCSGSYSMTCSLHQKQFIRYSNSIRHEVKLEAGGAWQKIELLVQNYNDYIIDLVTFKHEGKSTQNRFGRYNGCKMAGSVLKVLIDSINVEESN